MSLIFIAIPTKGTVVNGALTEEFLCDLAQMHVAFPQHTFISPMVQDYQLLKFMKVEPVWAEWGKHCRTIIERCDEVWVMQYHGWAESVGVSGEIQHAQSAGVPHFFIEPEVMRNTCMEVPTHSAA